LGRIKNNAIFCIIGALQWVICDFGVMSLRTIDFIGIGAAKSGTTWLYDVLSLHPQVCMSSKKEINYFNKYMPADLKTPNWNYDKSIHWYHSYFGHHQVGQICGELSPSYVMNVNAVEDIYNYNPDIKLIVVLREPIERLFSLYRYRKQIGNWQYRTFDHAVEHCPQFLSLSLYYEQLKIYFVRFSREQIKVLLFDDLKRNKNQFLLEVYDFLKIKPFFPEMMVQRSNVTVDVRSQKLNHLIGQMRLYIHRNNLHFILPPLRRLGVVPIAEYVRDKLNVSQRGKKAPELNKDLRNRLVPYFLKDIESLEKLIDRDLSDWKCM